MAYLLQQLLSTSVARNPDGTAVVFKNDSLTYQELDRLSNQLANTLRSHGVQAGDRVGIYLHKSVNSVVAIFGILKAGGVYVPLDPGAPAKRVAYIIKNCEMKGLVGSSRTVRGLAGALSDGAPVECLVLTDNTAGVGREALPQAESVAWPDVLQTSPTPPVGVHRIEDDLAYILYTSGSTGDPKGVMIAHRTALTFINWAYDCFGVKPEDRVSNHAPLHFDLSIFDVFCTIKAGGTVFPVPEALSIFPMNLADFIENQRISIWYSVPSVLTRMVLHGQLERHAFANLRTVLFAGEVFPVRFLRQLKELLPHPAYFNLYGPTETNVCTYYQVQDIPPSRVEPFPIGKACENTEVFAVTDEGKIAGAGEVGELCARGPGVMKGYWSMPEKTKAVLAPHPAYPSLWEERIYRTGDIVRLEADGNYTFIGRRDNMIKSRGYRIELGEIETALYSHPAVEEAAVIAIPDEEIGNAIKAVVVTRNGSNVSAGELLSFCEERIPKYMAPGLIEFLDSLPKTSTGKIDKQTLLKQHLERESTRT